MQIVKKSVVWSESGTSVKPNDVKIAEGWTGVPAEQPPAEWFNWILKSDEENINLVIDGNNVLDTELAAVITAGGLVPDLNPGGPGDQVKTAIFDSEALGTTALADDAVVDSKLGDDLLLDHFVGGTLDISSGTDIFSASLATGVQVGKQATSGLLGFYRTFVRPNDVEASYLDDATSPTKVSTVRLDPGPVGQYAPRIVVSTVDSGSSVVKTTTVEDDRIEVSDSQTNLETEINDRGLRFGGSSHIGATNLDLRVSVIDLPSAFEAVVQQTLTGDVELFGPGSVDAHGHPVGVEFATSGALASIGLPSSAVIMSASIRYTTTGGDQVFAPVSIIYEADSGEWKADRINCFTPQGGTGTAPNTSLPIKLIFVYDASGV